MRASFTKAAAMCLCASLLGFSPARTCAQGLAPFESSGALPGGGTYILRRDQTAETAAIQLWFRAPSAGYDLQEPGISRLALAAIAASSPPHGTSLTELVNGWGGTLSIEVYPDIASVGLSVPSWDAADAVRALTAAYFSPSISADGRKLALRDSAIASTESRFDTERALQDALFEQVFSSGPAHYAPIPSSTQDFTGISDADVDAFAARAFRQGNAVLALAGNVDTPLLSDVRSAKAGAPMDAPFDSTVGAVGVQRTQPGLVDGLGFIWLGPPIADAKAATTLDFIADYLFDAEHGIVARAVQATDPDTYLSGQFITLHDPGAMLVTVSGSGSDAIRAQVLDAVTALEKPMDDAQFAAARNAFEYHIFMQSQTPTLRADNLGWYAVEGNASYAPGDASGEYLRLAQSLDPAYVAQIVRTYLLHPSIVQLASSKKATT